MTKCICLLAALLGAGLVLTGCSKTQDSGVQAKKTGQTPPQNPEAVKATAVKEKENAGPGVASAWAAEQYEALAKAFQQEVQTWLKALQAAKTEEDRRAIATKSPDRNRYATLMWQLADKNSKDPAAVDALVWIVLFAPDFPDIQKVADKLVSDHIQDPKLGPMCQQLTVPHVWSRREKLLREILAKSSHEEVRGQAGFALAMLLQRLVVSGRVKRVEFQDRKEGKVFVNRLEPLSPEEAAKLKEQAEKLYGETITHHANIKLLGQEGTLGDKAKQMLVELRRETDIGKVAPEIVAEDLQGKLMRLSDYRGKVVLLDFWWHQ